MKRRINKSLKIVVSLLFFLWLFPHWMYSCAPEFPYAVFTYKYHPDFPLKNYAAGAIGIPQPTYARSYLVVAYRYLSGVSLNPGASATVRWRVYDGIKKSDTIPLPSSTSPAYLEIARYTDTRFSPPVIRRVDGQSSTGVLPRSRCKDASSPIACPRQRRLDGRWRCA